MYRIATNVCFDALNGRKHRAMPMDMSPDPSAPVLSSLGTPLPETTWVEPEPDGSVLPETSDPADLAIGRESVRMAFVAALQHLPPKQRAVLVLREVLRWKADEVAELLDTTVASVNSALQRARATMGAREPLGRAPDPLDPEHAALLRRYVDAFERYDMTALVALLHEDATQSMPPFSLWLSGPEDIAAWHVGPGGGCRGSRLVEVQANGNDRLRAVQAERDAGPARAWAVHLLAVGDGRITSITNFVGAAHFQRFGLPEHLDVEV
jgi:RNA polymerase sigma-70 factor (ECF subfamily)